MKVLLSIKPEYADKIFSGEKRVEFRRRVWTNDKVDTVIVYASAPTRMVIGEFSITPLNRSRGLWLDTIWFITRNYAGISKEEFYKYFKGKSRGYSIMIQSFKRYDKPRPLSDYGIARPPQNFMYLRDDDERR